MDNLNQLLADIGDAIELLADRGHDVGQYLDSLQEILDQLEAHIS